MKELRLEESKCTIEYREYLTGGDEIDKNIEVYGDMKLDFGAVTPEEIGKLEGMSEEEQHEAVGRKMATGQQFSLKSMINDEIVMYKNLVIKMRFDGGREIKGRDQIYNAVRELRKKDYQTLKSTLKYIWKSEDETEEVGDDGKKKQEQTK
jgi:hypothetical protein